MWISYLLNLYYSSNYTTLEEHQALKESLSKYGEVADISNVRNALQDIRSLVSKKAFADQVSQDINGLKQDLQSQIDARVKIGKLIKLHFINLLI